MHRRNQSTGERRGKSGNHPADWLRRDANRTRCRLRQRGFVLCFIALRETDIWRDLIACPRDRGRGCVPTIRFALRQFVCLGTLPRPSVRGLTVPKGVNKHTGAVMIHQIIITLLHQITLYPCNSTFSFNAYPRTEDGGMSQGQVYLFIQ